MPDTLPRYRVVVGFELAAADAEAAYAHVAALIVERNARQPANDLVMVLDARDTTREQVYQVGGPDGPEVAPKVAAHRAAQKPRKR